MNQTKPLNIPATTLRLMREFVKGVIAGAQYLDSDWSEVLEDGWIEYGKYDINIYRNRAGNISAAVHLVITNPNGTKSTDGNRFMRLRLN